MVATLRQAQGERVVRSRALTSTAHAERSAKRGVEARPRGATMVEVLISLAIVLVGMAGLFKVLSSSVAGSSAASRISQAQLRAQLLLESIRAANLDTLTCLGAQPPSAWGSCETVCRVSQSYAGGGTQAQTFTQSCIFTPASLALIPGATPTGCTSGSGQQVDRSCQTYFVVSNGLRDARDTFVNFSNRIFDVQVTIGWNDDNTAVAPGGASAANVLPPVPNHVVTFRSGEWR